MLTEKVDVNGKNSHALFTFLKGVRQGNKFSGDISWNFTYFLVGKTGSVLARWETGTDMSSPKVQKFIIDALSETKSEL